MSTIGLVQQDRRERREDKRREVKDCACARLIGHAALKSQDPPHAVETKTIKIETKNLGRTQKWYFGVPPQIVESALDIPHLLYCRSSLH